MDRGRIEQTGAPQDVFDHPVNAYVAQFTGANVIPGSLLDPSAEPDALVAVDPALLALDRNPVTAHSWRAAVTSLQQHANVLHVGLTVPPGAVADLALNGPDELAIGDTVTARTDPAASRPWLPAAPSAHGSHCVARPPGHASTGPATGGLRRSVAVAIGVTAAMTVAPSAPTLSPHPHPHHDEQPG